MFENRDFRVMETSQSRSFMQRVYSWMALALGISAISAYMVSSTPALFNLFYGNIAMVLVLFVAYMGLAIYFSARLSKMSPSAAIVVYLLYAVVSGIMLSSLFLAYTMTSLVSTLFVTLGMFLAMAIYGYFTKSDLSSLGDFLFMGLIGLIIASFVGFFVSSANFNLITAAFGVMIFTLFTAYDAQQIKHLGQQMLLSNQDMTKAALFGAFRLYLDFVNLFIYLLRLFGQRRD
jgi:FtsH-binding integral membrane protein